MQTQTFGWLYYRGMRAYLGQYRNRRYRYARRTWFLTHYPPPKGYICAICHDATKPMAILEVTLDHIIPVWAIYEYQLNPSLLWSVDNLQPAHGLCNTKKANKYKHHI